MQGMRHRADKLPGRITRQLRVRIKGNDVSDRGKNIFSPDYCAEAITTFAAQGRVEFGQLSALAFIAHPDTFASFQRRGR
jgi:hypothetical protein